MIMSCNREHVVWQSSNGLWNIGFFSFWEVNRDSEDFDYEWDVVYRYDVFFWGSSGRHTPESASRSWVGANPGAPEIFEYKGDEVWMCEKYDAMLVKVRQDPNSGRMW